MPHAMPEPAAKQMNPLCRIPTSVWVGLGAFILGCAIYRSEVSRLWLETAIGKTKEVPFVELGPRENEFVIRGFERGEDAFYLQAGAEGR